jgi:acyl-CoA synthetase (AMP-forming)/AMP-acid ligase II
MSALGMAPSSAVALLDTASGHGMTYRDLFGAARRLASVLEDPRSLVFVLCRNDAFTATAFAACMISDQVVAMLDGSRDVDVHLDLLTTYRPQWVLGRTGTAEALAGIGLPPIDVVAMWDGELVRITRGPRPGRIDPRLAVLLSTSGTTGSRKLVRLSRTNIDSNAAAIAGYLGLGPPERPVTSLPLHYTFGLSVLTSHLHAGSCVVLTSESVMQASFWDTVRRERCTSMAGVPFTFRILERVGYRAMDLPDLMVMQQAGGALEPNLVATYAAHMAAKGGRLYVMYGQTEATARIAYVPPEHLTTHLGSAGIAIPGGRIRIEGQLSREASGRTVGEVVYEGPNVMMGYATSGEDLGDGDELEGVLATGDLGYLDDDGYLFLVGRSKRIAKVFGLRLNLDELERMVEGDGPVAAIGGDDVVWVFCAFGTDASLAELGTRLAKRLSLHPSSLRMRRVDDLPTSSSGKVDYREVERWTLS